MKKIPSRLHRGISFIAALGAIFLDLTLLLYPVLENDQLFKEILKMNVMHKGGKNPSGYDRFFSGKTSVVAWHEVK